MPPETRLPSPDGLRRLASLQRMMQAMVRADEGLPEIAAAQADRFAAFELDPRDAELLASSDPRKIHVYRKLVRGTFLETVKLQMPLAAERLGEKYDEYVHAFCGALLPRSPILRDVAYEFAVFALPRWRSDARVPPWLGDLARFELLDFEVHCAPRTAAAAASEELAADLPLSFDASCRLGRFDFAVHEIEAGAAQARAEPTALLRYRDADNAVKQLTLSPLCAEIVAAALIDEAPLGEAVRLGCARAEAPLDRAVVDAVSTVLADLQERGALRGSLSCAPEKRPSWLAWLYYPARWRA